MKRLPIPAEALDQHLAITGKTGAGKTFTAKGLVEWLLGQSRRVCIVDPTGAWWGLKSSADGKRPGFPVVIFGGPHADVPIDRTSAAALGEFIASAAGAALVDLSEMGTREMHQFMAKFCESVYARNKDTLHLIIDEADEFAPQRPLPDTKVMLNRVDRIVRRGRIRGFRVMMITQRPAVLHKDVLTQANTLIAMRLTAPQDRNAIREWIKDQADLTEGKNVIESLVRLEPGTGWVWAPEFDFLERVKFPLIKTFDSSKAPEPGAEHPHVSLAEVDLGELRERFAHIEAEAKANDPAELKRRVAQLERDLAMAQRGAQDTAALREANERIRALAAERDNALRQINGMQGQLVRVAADMKNASDRLGGLIGDEMATAIPAAPVVASIPARPATPPAHSRGGNGSAPSRDGVRLPKGERATLIAAAQHPAGCTRTQLTILTGYKRSSRDAYIQRLREKAFISQEHGRIVATDAGVAALGSDYEPLPTGAALLDWWRERLPQGERQVLDVLVTRWPNAAARSEIDAVTDYRRSSRDAYIQRLKARELVTTGDDGVRAADTLFT